MPFQIGVMLDSFRLPAVQAAQESARLGASGVQFYAVDGELDARTMTRDAKQTLAREFERCQLTVAAICGDMGGHGFALPEENDWRISRSVQIAQLAAEFSCPVVTTHIGVIPTLSPASTPAERKTHDNMRAVCSKIGQEAAKLGVRFAAETGPEHSETMRAFLDSLDTDSFCVNFDPANIVMVTGEDVVQAVETLAPYLVHTHAKDGVMLQKGDPKRIYGFFAQGGIGDLRIGDYFEERPLGQGDVPFGRYLDALERVGYQGFLTVEREVGQTPCEDIALAVSFLKEELQKR